MWAAGRIVAQQLLLAPAVSQQELAQQIESVVGDHRATDRRLPPVADQPLLGSIASPAPGTRWSGDSWLLLREDSARSLVTGRPAYGRSQAGAVLRYRLAFWSGYRPAAYARVSRSLDGSRGTEVAAGLTARPLPGVPLGVAAELRAYESAAGRELRPAAFAVTELPPVELPHGLRGEVYAQAGYVGGDFSTAFADGQGRVDGRVLRLGEGAEVRMGGAAWGGAQKNASRLDVGPSVTVAFSVGRASLRVAADYRFRVAGDAEPKSGPALTFSAGF